jgi:hypothetical protein
MNYFLFLPREYGSSTPSKGYFESIEEVEGGNAIMIVGAF